MTGENRQCLYAKQYMAHFTSFVLFQQCFKIENDHMLATCAPKDSHAYKNFSHGVGKTSHKFTFSKIFPQDTTQKELFDSAMLGLVQNFIKGQNCLVFTYGITSSGKTYTIQGECLGTLSR